MYTGTQTSGRGQHMNFPVTWYLSRAEKKNDPDLRVPIQAHKTIKNYLQAHLQPVGKALYVWGGGWNDSTRKGLSQTMTDWYNKWSIQSIRL